MAYVSFNKIKEDRRDDLPDFEEPVLITIENNASKDRMVVEGVLTSINKNGAHWVFGENFSLDPLSFTVIAWSEMPDPYTYDLD